jgi:hypothetical protein
MEKSKNRRVLIVLLLMLLIGFVSTQGFLETSIFIKSQILLKYGIYFLWLVLMLLIGVWGWKNYPQLWVMKVWLAAYSFAISVLLLLGCVDLGFGTIPLYYKKDISHFRSFFLSPSLFVLLYILSVFAKENENKR